MATTRFRKPARDGFGLYLVGDGIPIPCARLPHDLTSCPVYGGGIKPSRNWARIVQVLPSEPKPEELVP